MKIFLIIYYNSWLSSLINYSKLLYCNPNHHMDSESNALRDTRKKEALSYIDHGYTPIFVTILPLQR